MRSGKAPSARRSGEPEAGGGGPSPASFDLDAIALLSREECRDRWVRAFGHMPPRHISVQIMRKALAYEAQVNEFGRLSAAVARALRDSLRNSGGAKVGAAARRSSPMLRPGIHLVREWNGRTYQVEVLEDGCRLDGKTYRSLTAVARKITGAHWSGPRFFGLR